MFNKNKNETQEQYEKIMSAYDEIIRFQSKYGVTQGNAPEDTNKFWTDGEKDLFWNGNKPGKDGDFVIKDISTSEMVYARFLNIWKQFTRTAFGEEWKGNDLTKHIKDRIEECLFSGRVALFKEMKTGHIIAESFTYDDKDLNIATGLPNKITLVSKYKNFDKKELKKDFVIGFNNSTRTSEIAYDNPAFEMIVNSYMHLIMAIKKSKPLTLITGTEDSTMVNDIKRAIQSDSYIEVVNVTAKYLTSIDVRFEVDFKEKMEMVMGSIADFIKFKGFNSNGIIMKRERQSESELDNNDEFKHYLVWNKIEERRHLAEQIKEVLKVDITYDGEGLLNMIKGEEKEEDIESENEGDENE